MGNCCELHPVLSKMFRTRFLLSRFRAIPLRFRDARSRCDLGDLSQSTLGAHIMSTLGFIEYEKASPEVRAVYDDIKATRKIDKVTNFWKALAHDPARLKRTW